MTTAAIERGIYLSTSTPSGRDIRSLLLSGVGWQDDTASDANNSPLVVVEDKLDFQRTMNGMSLAMGRHVELNAIRLDPIHILDKKNGVTIVCISRREYLV